MNIYTSILIIISAFYFVSIKYGLVACVACLLKFLIDLGIFSSIKIYKGKFQASDIYYIKILRNKIIDEDRALLKVNTALEKFKLDKNIYTLTAIYYNDLKTETQWSHAIIGIRVDNTDSFANKNDKLKDFKEYLLSDANNFKIGVLPDLMCLRASIPVNYSWAKTIGINKFSKLLKASIADKEFIKTYGVQDSPQFVIHEYRADQINFFVPLKNNAIFMKLIEETQ